MGAMSGAARRDISGYERAVSALTGHLGFVARSTSKGLRLRKIQDFWGFSLHSTLPW